MHTFRVLIGLLVMVGWLNQCHRVSASALAMKQPGEETKTEDSAGEPVKREVLTVSGVFESVNEVEVLVDATQTNSWKIKTLADHGASVTKGQNLVVFESDAIDESIQNSEIAFRLAKLALEDAEFDFDQFVETQKLDRVAAESDRKNARQAYDNFFQVDRERQVLTAEFTLKASESSLENAKEELDQLQQMYDEDDLTEESEEIVLKRAKQAVESAMFRFEAAKINSQRSIEQTIPKSEQTQERNLAKAEMDYQKSIRELKSSRQRREIEIQQKRDDLDKQAEKLDELRQERKQLVLRSPIDGIFLHGKLNRGRLADKPSQLARGSTVTAKQVIATVVNPNRLRIRATLDQAKLGKLSVGEECDVTCDAYPGFAACGTVKSVDAIGFANGKHDCVVQFKMPRQGPAILPTMTCQLQFAAAESDAETSEAPDKDDAKDE